MKLIDKDPTQRPKPHQILGNPRQEKTHPVFWTDAEKMKFICLLSYDLQNYKNARLAEACDELEDGSPVGEFQGLKMRMQNKCNGKCGKNLLCSCFLYF